MKRAKRQLPTLPSNFLDLPAADQDAVMQAFMRIFDMTHDIAEREQMLQQLRNLDRPKIPHDYIDLSASERAAVRARFNLPKSQFSRLPADERRRILRCLDELNQLDNDHPAYCAPGEFDRLGDDDQDRLLDSLFAEWSRRKGGKQLVATVDDEQPATADELAQLRSLWGDE